MERRKRRWASRLLVVCLCMTMVLMGIQVIPGTSMAARPPKTVDYWGPDIYVQWNWTLVTPLCIPRTPTGADITASWWCDHMRDTGGVTHNDWVVQIVWSDPISMTDKTYYGLTNSGTDFYIQCGYSYWVQARYEGYLPIDHSSGTFANPTYIGKSVCPKTYDVRLYGDNEPGRSGWNYVGPIWWCQTTAPPPVPPPPWAPYAYMLSMFRGYLTELDGSPYLGYVSMAQWNNTDVFHPFYEYWSPDWPYDYAHHTNYGVGNIHWGVEVYLTHPGLWHSVNP